MKISDSLKEKIESIINEILESDLSNHMVEKIADRWVECALEVMSQNGIEYSDEDVAVLRNRFMERLIRIREHLPPKTL